MSACLPPKHILVSGPPATGKSSAVIAALIAAAATYVRTDAGLYAQYDNATAIKRIERSIHAQVTPPSADTVVSSLAAALTARAVLGPLYLILDNAERLTPEARSKVVDALIAHSNIAHAQTQLNTRRLPRSVCIVVISAAADAFGDASAPTELAAQTNAQFVRIKFSAATQEEMIDGVMHARIQRDTADCGRDVIGLIVRAFWHSNRSLYDYETIVEDVIKRGLSQCDMTDTSLAVAYRRHHVAVQKRFSQQYDGADDDSNDVAWFDQLSASFRLVLIAAFIASNNHRRDDHIHFTQNKQKRQRTRNLSAAAASQRRANGTTKSDAAAVSERSVNEYYFDLNRLCNIYDCIFIDGEDAQRSAAKLAVSSIHSLVADAVLSHLIQRKSRCAWNDADCQYRSIIDMQTANAIANSIQFNLANFMHD